MAKNSDAGETGFAICRRCRRPVAFKWRDGFIAEPHNELVADAVYHAECWETIVAEYIADDPPEATAGEIDAADLF